jgi:cephalosporin hydroxylase
MKPDDILSRVTKLPTDIYGLKWFPSVEPHISNDTDWIDEPKPCPTVHFSSVDHSALEYAFSKLPQAPKLIVEIGVDECGGVTSTNTLLRIKPQDCMYVGIDIRPKSYLNNLMNNIFTIQTDSANHEELYKLMDWYGHEQIDFMFVDGWHSVNQVIKEWKYWEKMIPNGVMAFHDTNHHPGPVAVLDAIDRDIFSVEYFGRDETDWGVGVVQRIRW